MPVGARGAFASGSGGELSFFCVLLAAAFPCSVAAQFSVVAMYLHVFWGTSREAVGAVAQARLQMQSGHAKGSRGTFLTRVGRGHVFAEIAFISDG